MCHLDRLCSAELRPPSLPHTARPKDNLWRVVCLFFTTATRSLYVACDCDFQVARKSPSFVKKLVSISFHDPIFTSCLYVPILPNYLHSSAPRAQLTWPFDFESVRFSSMSPQRRREPRTGSRWRRLCTTCLRCSGAAEGPPENGMVGRTTLSMMGY